jgi:hypothetical protein
VSASPSGWAAGLLLIVLGVWLLLQTLIGKLPSRIAGTLSSSSSSGGGDGTPAIPGKTLPATGGATIDMPGRGLVNPAPSPGWAGYQPPALAPLPKKTGGN